MVLEVEVEVAGAKDEVWRIVSDIDGSPEVISGIDEVEVLERPDGGLLGLKWRETRTIMGRSATETMWITDVVDGSYYRTEARSHGATYRTRVFVEEVPGREEGAEGVSRTSGPTRLGMVFDARPESFGARLMWGLTGFLMKRATRKALLQDLNDIKAAVESRRSESP